MQGPSAVEMIFNLADTARDVLNTAVSKGAVLATDEMIKTRQSLCFECDYFDKEGFVARCMKCGCGMKVKSRLYGAKCPLGKW